MSFFTMCYSAEVHLWSLHAYSLLAAIMYSSNAQIGLLFQCAMIQLPSQTLFLSVSNRDDRLIGLLLPAVIF
jgi:hypothetical protein